MIELTDNLRPGQLDKLTSKIKNFNPNRNELCGHLLTDIVSSDEGTNYCSKCEQEAILNNTFINKFKVIEKEKLND